MSCSCPRRRSSSGTAHRSSTRSSGSEFVEHAGSIAKRGKEQAIVSAGSKPGDRVATRRPPPQMIRRAEVKRRFLLPAIALAVVAAGAAHRRCSAHPARARQPSGADGARDEGPAEADRPCDRRAACGPHGHAGRAAGRRHAADRQAGADRRRRSSRTKRSSSSIPPISSTRSSRRNPSWRRRSRKSSR